MNMHAASGLCTRGVSDDGGGTGGHARHNSSNVGGVTACQVRHNYSMINYHNRNPRVHFNDVIPHVHISMPSSWVVDRSFPNPKSYSW